MRLRLVLLAVVATVGAADAQTTYNWTGGSSGGGVDWNTPQNWDNGNPPGGANLVFNNVNGAGLIATPMGVTSTRAVGSVTFDNVNNRLPATLVINTNDNGSAGRTLTFNTGIVVANHAGTVQFNATTNGTMTFALGAANVTFEPRSTSTLVLNPVITGAGSGLTKAGTGTLVLGGANTYTGNTAITAGTLTLAAAGSVNSSATISVASGATYNVAAVSGGYTLGGTTAQTLRGSGTLTGGMTVTANGTVFADALGSTPLTTGSVLFNAGGNLQARLGDGGTVSDLTLTGSSRLAATTFGRTAATGLIDVLVVTDGSLVANTTYTRRIATYTALQNLTEGTTYTAADNVFTVTSPEFAVTAGWQIQVSGGFVDLTFSPVPEPATAGLIGVAALGVVGVVRRKLRPAAV